MDSASVIESDDIVLGETVNTKARKPDKQDKPDDPPHSHMAPLKVELQTVRLNGESQRIVMETLRYLRGSDFELGSSCVYKDKGTNLKNKYWIGQGGLEVQGGYDYSKPRQADTKTHNDMLRMYALRKLERYYFHPIHCAEALDLFDSEVDKALELLFNKYYEVDPEKRTDIPIDQGEIETARQEEMAVLESIYDTAFKVKDKNTWSVSVECDYITNLYKKKDEKVVKRKEDNTKKKKLCNFYLVGPCKFGAKCKFLHEKPTDTRPIDAPDKIEYELEIRFQDESVYPYQVPLLFFKTVNKTDVIPDIVFLRVTRKLVQEAQTLVESGTSSVFSLVQLLSYEEDIIDTINFDVRKFPQPNQALVPQLIEEVKKGPTHYEKGQARQRRSKVNDDQNEHLLKLWRAKQTNSKYKERMAERKQLPAWGKREEILDALKKNQVVVISGDTGCGKSTQIPQYIIDEWFEGRAKGDQGQIEVVCTQPRRICAIGVAERVADEQLSAVGQLVGYTIRLENKTSAMTRLTFCTTGILLRRLAGDSQLGSVTHVIVDEVHERSEESDFLLMILRDLLRARKDLRVILMSATLNAGLFTKYFNGAPLIEIPGRTFEVKQLFLEQILELSEYDLDEKGPYARRLKNPAGKKEKFQDTCLDLEPTDIESLEPPLDSIRDENLNMVQLLARYKGYHWKVCNNLLHMDLEKVNLDLIAHTIRFIVEGEHEWPREGYILVFLPGIAEITSLYELLVKMPELSSDQFEVIPLHSSLSGEEQARVFKKVPKSVRKIVLSTNIAETSITIDKCVFVVDSGRMKEKSFNPNTNMESLDMVWASRANARQRMGRAGRVMPGVCVHMFTSNFYTNQMSSQPVPEMQRVPLEQLILRIKTLPIFQNMSTHDVLGKTLEPPKKANVDGALIRLQDVGALDKAFELTPLGQHLAALPVDVRIGKLMLLGAVFHCVDSALTIAACLAHKSPFTAPFSKKAQAVAKKKEFALSNSDQLTDLRAFRMWQESMKLGTRAAFSFADRNFLSHKTLLMLRDMKLQYLGLLESIGFVPALPEGKRRRADNFEALIPAELNANGDNDKILSAILCAALYPNLVKVLTPEKSFHMAASGAVPRMPQADELRFKTKSGPVALHPSSINYGCSHFASPYLVYQEMVKTSRVFVRDCTMVPRLPLLLFTGCDLAIEVHNGRFIVSLEDGWIMFQVDKQEVAEMLKAIRVELINLLDEKIKEPSLDLLNYEKGKKIIETIVHVITKD